MIKKILFIIGVLVVYQLVFVFAGNLSMLPSVPQIASALFDSFIHIDMYKDIFASVSRVIIGVIFASFLGITFGLLIAHYRQLSFTTIIIDLLKPIPPIAWIPISIILFGLGNTSSYFIVFLGAFFPIFSNTYYGAKSIPIIYKNCALSFKIKSNVYISKILLPYTLPYIFNGIKTGIGMGWMSVIAAELIGAQSGLGYSIQMNRLLLRTDKIIVGMMLIGCIGFLLQKMIEYLEIKTILWK